MTVDQAGVHVEDTRDPGATFNALRESLAASVLGVTEIGSRGA